MTMLAGVIGQDTHGDDISDLLSQTGIDGGAVLPLDTTRTAVKTRILAGGRHTTRQQIVRLDRCPEVALSDDDQQRLARLIEERAAEADAIVISDYGFGLVTDEIFRRLLNTAKRRSIPITVDTRYDFPKYPGVTAQTPNETEIEELLGVQLQTDEAKLIATARDLRAKLALKALLVTRGSKGMLLVDESGHEAIPIFGSDEVADVTGAGDTVIAVFTLALASGASNTHAARLANIAGGIVVMKRGTATVSAHELASAVKALPDDV